VQISSSPRSWIGTGLNHQVAGPTSLPRHCARMLPTSKRGCSTCAGTRRNRRFTISTSPRMHNLTSFQPRRFIHTGWESGPRACSSECPLGSGPGKCLIVSRSKKKAFEVFSSINFVLNSFNGTNPATFLQTGLQWDFPNVCLVFALI
jgi:hypothetical protein